MSEVSRTYFGIEMASTASCRNTASSRNFCSHYLHRHYTNYTKLYKNKLQKQRNNIDAVDVS